MAELAHILTHVLIDTLKTAPILFIVYLLIELMEHKLSLNHLLNKFHKFGPAIGAIGGLLPQCGVSVAASTLYKSGVITASTLIATFIATSDEAIPIMLAHSENIGIVLKLMAVKLVIAIIAGYFLKFTIFRKESIEYTHEMMYQTHTKEPLPVILKNALIHTVKILVFLAVILFIINVAVHAIGQDNIGKFLLGGTIFQPILTALIGLIPTCATSILITELFLSGTISFASAIAGLSTGAGFGLIILFRNTLKDKSKLKDALKILLITYIIGALAGVILQLFSL